MNYLNWLNIIFNGFSISWGDDAVVTWNPEINFRIECKSEKYQMQIHFKILCSDDGEISNRMYTLKAILLASDDSRVFMREHKYL